jgi:hypothetical protein
MEQYTLRPDEQPGWWIVTDVINNISVRFEQAQFDDTMFPTIHALPGESTRNKARRMVKALTDIEKYMDKYHHNLAFGYAPRTVIPTF